MPGINHTKEKITYSSNAFRLWLYGIVLAVLMLSVSIVSVLDYLKPAFAKKLGKIDVYTLVGILTTALFAFGLYVIFAKANYKFEYRRDPAIPIKANSQSTKELQPDIENKQL